MGYNMESGGRAERTSEVSRPPVERRPEPVEARSEDRFDDCAVKEVRERTDDRPREPGGAERLEESFEDCAVRREVREKGGAEGKEDGGEDLFSDCGKEAAGEERAVKEKKPAQTAEAVRGTELEKSSEAVQETEPEKAAETVREAELEKSVETVRETEPEKAAEAVRETEPEKAVEAGAEQPDFREGVAETAAKEEPSWEEMRALKRENQARLAEARERQERAAAEAEEKFRASMEAERGTEEFRQALREHTQALERKDGADAEVLELSQNGALLEQRSLALREAQLKRGEQALAESARAREECAGLEARFDQAYYAEKPDRDALAELQEENTAAIRRLSAERDTMGQAAEAKMEEIREYVNARNMDPRDTARDPAYQRMIEEYSAMRDGRSRTNYEIVKLDENNISIAGVNGTEYTSIRFREAKEIAPEVARGTDDPRETDYFVDEVKAAERLSPFRQERWEKLTVEEQKEAVERLADYNAELLGIDGKPMVCYYYDQEAGNLGYYSRNSNAIFLNECNLQDPSRMANTVSHEYRHCYQHERAEKLENERDLEFKEGFDNYVRPEDDYQAYRDQLVEADARAYADAVEEKIASLEEVPEEAAPPARVEAAERLEDRPRANAPPEGLQSHEVPKDAAASRELKEVRDPKEVFEVREIEEIKGWVRPKYENGAEVARKLGGFEGYKEHCEVDGGHIEKVYQKSLEAADVLEDHFGADSFGGAYSGEIDRKTLTMAAFYHDTGMDGNIDAARFEEAREKLLTEDPGKLEEYVGRELGRDPNLTREQAERNFVEKRLRGDHAMQSAIHALRDRELMEEKGVSADEVALTCLLHSKSNSGVDNLMDEGQWSRSMERLQSAVERFNREHPEESIDFDPSFLKTGPEALDQEKLARMRSQCLCLRLGDANGHDFRSRTSQGGKSIEFDLGERREIPSDALLSREKAADLNGLMEEMQGSVVYIGGKELVDETDREGLGRAFAVGEGNFREMKLETADGVPRERISLVEADAFPLATQFCIEERIKEINTAKVELDQRPDRNEGESVKDYEARCRRSANQTAKAGITVAVELRGASDRTRESYRNFAVKMRQKYNIMVEIPDENTE